ncbi:hypothetical protein FACS1894105_04410 [Clostridia bacterium]|nr:hypothetical protein FACS1894105_04410 [Clostridia bacterium]
MTGVYCNMHVSMKSVFGSRENRLKDFADYMLSNHKKFNTILDDEYIEKINLIPEQANNKIAETIKIIIDSGGCNGLINIIL